MIEKTAQKSRELFGTRPDGTAGYYCAESVLIAIAESKGFQSDLIPKIATGFCSGVARTGGMCGAVSGAILAISALYGRREASEADIEKNYALIQEFLSTFEDKFGSINCQELIGCHLGTEEGQAAFKANNRIEQCKDFVEEATRIAMTVIEQV